MKILAISLVALVFFLIGRFVERRIFFKKTGVRLEDVKDYSNAKKQTILRNRDLKEGLQRYPFWYACSSLGISEIHIEPEYDPNPKKEALVVENFCNIYITFKIGDKKTVLCHEEVQRMIPLLIAMIAPLRYYKNTIPNSANKLVKDALRDIEKLTNN